MGLAKFLATVGLVTALGVIGYNSCAADKRDIGALVANKPEIVWQSETLNLKDKESLVKQGLESLSLEGKIAVLSDGYSGLDQVSQYEVISTTLENMDENNLYRITADGLYGLSEQKGLELIEGYVSLLEEDPRKNFLMKQSGYCNDESKKEIASIYAVGLGKSIAEKIYGVIKGAKVKLSRTKESKEEIELAPGDEEQEKETQ